MAKKKEKHISTTGRPAVDYPKVLYKCHGCGSTSWRENLLGSIDKLQCPHCLEELDNEPTYYCMKEYIDDHE